LEVHVLFFASYREGVGSGRMDVRLPIGAKVSDLISELHSKGKKFTCLPDSVVVAVNHVYSEPVTTLNDGDEVAFIPPVAGG
jgi:molybdopterin converting factor subunit 1